MNQSNLDPNQEKNKKTELSGWFYKLGIKLTKTNILSLVIISFFISFGKLYFDPIAWLGSAALAISLSKLELTKIIQNIIFALIVSAFFSSIYHFINQLPTSIFQELIAIIIQSFMPALMIALGYKVSQSLSFSLLLLLDWMFLLSILLIPFYQDMINLIQNTIENILVNSPMSEMFKDSLVMLGQKQTNWAVNIFTFLFGSLYIQYTLIAMIAKKWLNQSQNINLSFTDELVKLTTFNWLGFLMILLMVAAYWLNDILWLKLVFAIFVAYFFIIGLSITHRFFRKRNIARGVIIFAYILIFVFIEISVVIINTIAIGHCVKNFLIKNK